jgi:hypothetical protein
VLGLAAVVDTTTAAPKPIEVGRLRRYAPSPDNGAGDDCALRSTGGKGSDALD